MCRQRYLVASCAMLSGLAFCGYAYSLPTYTVEVRAPERGYAETPVSVLLPAPGQAASGAATVTELGAGKRVPCTAVEIGGQAEVTWVVTDLAQGGSRRYRVAFGNQAQPPGDTGVALVELEPDEEGEGRAVAVTIGDELFTRYWFEGAPKPYCYPIIGPTGKPVTRAYPMEDVAGESSDHHHHRSLWFTFGEVNGVDFWAEGENTGREVHRTFEALASGEACGLLRAVNDWVTADGRKMCEDVRELRVYNMADVRVLDLTVTIRATEGPVEFGDTKEGMFGIRVASTMRLRGGDGHISNSEGQRDDETWGKSAAWCDYSGPVGDELVGIAIFDHPANFRHPTYWHVRNYGLFAANPFGLRHFIGDKTGAGRHTLPKGEELTFRYRVLIHRGTSEEARIADWYAEYAEPPIVEVKADD